MVRVRESDRRVMFTSALDHSKLYTSNANVFTIISMLLRKAYASNFYLLHTRFGN